ncbi:Acetyltransferase (GNAT) family protein [Shimia gijangensis]|uniref:Acetyltransferase (GNAT) family protein n=1 Tax=Shimia gijangensis TaxID=1470563 RepID=A0A1M6JG60_9RHOB|nr:GNAT family N-acetyltransferase [Shimia gijangensis]SHJ45670.1 Acetyltransferase (GNAT) family protein [Shimia gijangensis]
MSLPDAKKLYDVIDATWPSASKLTCGPFIIGDGQDGGKRVSSATATGPFQDTDIDAAEVAMRKIDQTPLFQIREGDEALDAALSARGYEIIDPVTMYAIEAEKLTSERPPRTAAIETTGPLNIMREIWASGGLGPGRVEVMNRACRPKAGFVSRWNDKPAGSSFVAMHDGVSMVHAIEIVPFQRRQGVARWLMIRAAFWTLDNGGDTLTVICTSANTAANSLYSSLGMFVVGQYHYRILPD